MDSHSSNDDKIIMAPSNVRSTTTTTKEKPKSSGGDDLDLMLQHECFAMLLELTVQIRKEYQIIQDQTGQAYTSQQKLPTSSLTPEETMRATFCLQQKLLSNPDVPRTVIHRGQYPITDAIMDDSLRMLKQELEDVRNYVRTPASKKRARSVADSPAHTVSKKEAIAIKYAKWQTDILMKWMVRHSNEPFPDQAAVAQLMAQTGLSPSQVVNWTTNVRKRNKKATCQGGKKPHHFIDFLFLVQDREKQERMQGMNPQNSAPTTVSQPPSVMVTPPRSYSSERHNIEDEPFSLDENHIDDDLMEEFASTWLWQPPSTPSDHTFEILGDALDDFIAENQSRRPRTLMPSVTNDSADDELHRKRPRFDDYDSELLDDWVQSFDFKLQGFDVDMDM